MFAVHGLPEARVFIDPSGLRVVFLDLKGDFAAAKICSLLRNLFKQKPPDSISSKRGKYGKIMDIDERLGGEGRKSPEAGCDSDGLAFHVRQQNQRRRLGSQSRYQTFQYRRRKRSPISHFVLGIGSCQSDHVSLVIRAVQVGFYDLNVRFHSLPRLSLDRWKRNARSERVAAFQNSGVTPRTGQTSLRPAGRTAR